MKKIKLPSNVEYIIAELERAGYEAYAVGGCVRDRLLGRVPGDWDITTQAKPEQVKEIFAEKNIHTIDTGMLFLRILSPFYFVVSVKLVADGILRGCGLMVRFMIATFTDLILRVGIAAVLSATALGSTGIWMAWPVGWCIGTALSMVFYATAIRKALAEPMAVAETEGQAAETRAEAEFAADAEMETL